MNAETSQNPAPGTAPARPVVAGASVELCALEIANAADQGILRTPNERLTRLSRDLIAHTLRLMDDVQFQGVICMFAWDSVNAGPEIRSSPLTQDLVPRVYGQSKAAQQKEALRFMKETAGDLMKKLRERIGALQERIIEKSLSGIEHTDHKSLEQLSECVFKFILKRSLPRQIDEIRPTKPMEFVIPATAEYAAALSKVLPAGTEPLRREAVALFLAHRLAGLQLARQIDDPALMAATLQRRLEAVDPLFNAELMKSVIERAAAIRSLPVFPTFRRFLDTGLSSSVLTPETLGAIDTVADLAYLSEIRVTRAWLEQKARGIEALMAQEVIDCTFKPEGARPIWRKAVQLGLVSNQRAIELQPATSKEGLAPNEELKIHLMTGRAPRIVEAVILTGAHSVTVCGDLASGVAAPEGELFFLAAKACSLIKLEPPPLKPMSVVSAASPGEEIVKAELAGVVAPCAGTYRQDSAPEPISALEKRCGGPVAWVEDQDGALKFALVFDGSRVPEPERWQSSTVAPRIVRAVPLQRIELRPPKPAAPVVSPPAPPPAAVERPAVPAIAAAQSVTQPPPAKKPESAPPPPQAPTHVLPPQFVTELGTWIAGADALKLFSFTLEGEQAMLRKAAKGKPLSAGEHRALLRLEGVLTNRKHMPTFTNIAIPIARESLAQLISRLNSGQFKED